MAGFDVLLNDPIAQLAYGLLVAGSPGGNMQQGFGAALGLRQQGQQEAAAAQQAERQARQDEMQEKLYQLKVKEASQPSIQYMMDDAGNVVGIDKRTATGFQVPVGQMGQAINPPSGGMGQELPMPPFPGGKQGKIPAFDTTGLSPKSRQLLQEKQIEQQFPSPAEQEKLRDLEKQRQGKIDMAAETKRLIDDVLKDKDAIRAAVGPISKRLTTYRGSTAEAENAIRRLGNLETAGNLNLMSGVLSESDIQILKDLAGGQYDINRDEDKFIADLERIQRQLNQNMFSTGGGTRESAAPQTIESGGFKIRRVR